MIKNSKWLHGYRATVILICSWEDLIYPYSEETNSKQKYIKRGWFFCWFACLSIHSVLNLIQKTVITVIGSHGIKLIIYKFMHHSQVIVIYINSKTMRLSHDTMT